MRKISAANSIQMYLHCARCLRECPDGVSPSEYQQVEVGWTPIGLQVRCKRHQANVIHVDFDGKKPRANLAADDGSPDAEVKH